MANNPFYPYYDGACKPPELIKIYESLPLPSDKYLKAVASFLFNIVKEFINRFSYWGWGVVYYYGLEY